MAADMYSSVTQGAVGKHSNLQKDQVFKDKGNYSQNNSPYSGNNVFKNDSPFDNKRNPFEDRSPFGKDDVDGGPKYLRFSDLKILNENMMHMSNNTLDDESRIEILSQGEKGEIKNLLAGRIVKIPFVPALSSLATAFFIIAFDSVLLTIFAMLVYMAILVRVFFFPAKLYYENIKYKTTKPARRFFEEMDYWYKISVVNIYVYIIIVSIAMFIFSFYEEEIISSLIELTSSSQNLIMTETKKYLSTISFSTSLKVLAIFNIIMLVVYSKFANKEKSKAEAELKNRMRLIRNETLTRVQQIQADKNEEK